MNLSAKDPSITFENVTEAVALLFCHTYSPERDFKVRLLWLLFSLEPTFFCFYPTIWAVLCRFAFWNTLSSRDSEVLQSSSLSVLISFLCFFGSRVLVVVVISWCCGQVQSQWCITKDLKKREQYQHQKRRQTNNSFRNTEKLPLLCLLWFLGSEADLLCFSQFLLSLVLLWLFLLFAYCLVINNASLVFVVLTSGVLWLVLIAVFFLGLLWIIALSTVNKISQSGKYHNTCIL